MTQAHAQVAELRSQLAAAQDEKAALQQKLRGAENKVRVRGCLPKSACCLRAIGAPFCSHRSWPLQIPVAFLRAAHARHWAHRHATRPTPPPLAGDFA